MKQILQYQSNDGPIFGTEKECRDYESLVEAIRRLYECTIGTQVKDTAFLNGAGYIQHAPENVAHLRDGFIDLCKPHIPNCRDLSFGALGRTLDDGHSPVFGALSRVWSRIFCIDQNCREWGQAFYALNPTQGKQVEWKGKK